jgi:hypothetical protein
MSEKHAVTYRHGRHMAFARRWGRCRPRRPYRPTARIHKGLRADGTLAACAQPAHNAPNRAPTLAHVGRGQGVAYQGDHLCSVGGGAARRC